MNDRSSDPVPPVDGLGNLVYLHTVWRDFTGDFGRDRLREHYEATKGTRHRHTGK